jgi:hypothetical protein
MAIYCHTCAFDEKAVRRALFKTSEAPAGFSHLRQLAIDTRNNASEETEAVLCSIGYDEDWLSDSGEAWRVEEWVLTVMAPTLRVLRPLQPALIGTLLIALSVGGWDTREIKILLEGQKSLSLLIGNNPVSGSIIDDVPVTSKRWLDLTDVQRLANRLENMKDLFSNPTAALVERLKQNTPEGWQHGWNVEPKARLEESWRQISDRFEVALTEGKALLQWSDAPLRVEG